MLTEPSVVDGCIFFLTVFKVESEKSKVTFHHIPEYKDLILKDRQFTHTYSNEKLRFRVKSKDVKNYIYIKHLKMI